MSFWNYIGEFFLFRWLFGKFRKSATKHDAHIEDLGASIDRDGKHLNVNHDEDIAPIDDAVTPIGDNLLGDSDNSEELDDLDIFMRDNDNRSYYDRNYDSIVRHCSHNDWNSGNYNQSFDDFHDEQDDYDMMDDVF